MSENKYPHYKPTGPAIRHEKRGEKPCTHCKAYKPLSDFWYQYNHQRGSYSFQSWCKECNIVHTRQEQRIGRANQASYLVSDTVEKYQKAGEKHCPRCKQTLPIDRFRLRTGAPRKRYNSWCRECAASYRRENYKTGKARASQKAWLKERRETQSELILSATHCDWCGDKGAVWFWRGCHKRKYDYRVWCSKKCALAERADTTEFSNNCKLRKVEDMRNGKISTEYGHHNAGSGGRPATQGPADQRQASLPDGEEGTQGHHKCPCRRNPSQAERGGYGTQKGH